MSKEELTLKVTNILDKKNITTEQKKYILSYFLAIFDNYDPPRFIKTTKEQYINRYLKVLENLDYFTFIEIEDLNSDDNISKEFRKSIVETTKNDGYIGKIKERYIKDEHGIYIITLDGLSLKDEHGMKSIYVLNRDDNVDNLLSFHHEMTHQTEGENPFPIKSNIPFSFEFRKMCLEGNSAINETYLKDISNNQQEQTTKLTQGNVVTLVTSKNSYSLDSSLYQLLILIFGEEVMNYLLYNDSKDIDMIDILYGKYKKETVDIVLSSIIYILSHNTEIKDINKVLEVAIKNYKNSSKHDNFYIGKKDEQIQILKLDLDKEKERETNLRRRLSSEELLKQDFTVVISKMRQLIEKDYNNRKITNEEYLKHSDEIDQVDLEKYKELLTEELESVCINISEIEGKITLLEAGKAGYQNSLNINFVDTLEKMYIKKTTIKDAFKKLCEIALIRIKTDYEQKNQDERVKEKSAYEDKIQAVLDTIYKIEETNDTKKAQL